MTSSALPRLRCVAVWLAASTLTAALCAALLPAVRRPLPEPFDLLLIRACEWALLGCVIWLWILTTAVVAEAIRAHWRGEAGGARLPGTPAVLRRVVLAACGVAVVTGLAGLAGPTMAGGVQPSSIVARHLPAHPTPRLGPLPFPSLPGTTSQVVMVHPGDSLWTIAARRLGAGAPASAVAAEWHRIYTLNRAVIGDDPALIEPGQRLVMPSAAHDG